MQTQRRPPELRWTGRWPQSSQPARWKRKQLKRRSIALGDPRQGVSEFELYGFGVMLKTIVECAAGAPPMLTSRLVSTRPPAIIRFCLFKVVSALLMAAAIFSSASSGSIGTGGGPPPSVLM